MKMMQVQAIYNPVGHEQLLVKMKRQKVCNPLIPHRVSPPVPFTFSASHTLFADLPRYTHHPADLLCVGASLYDLELLQCPQTWYTRKCVYRLSVKRSSAGSRQRVRRRREISEHR